MAGLSNNCPVIHIGKKSGVQELGRPDIVQLHNWSNVQSRQDGREAGALPHPHIRLHRIGLEVVPAVAGKPLDQVGFKEPDDSG